MNVKNALSGDPKALHRCACLLFRTSLPGVIVLVLLEFVTTSCDQDTVSAGERHVEFEETVEFMDAAQGHEVTFHEEIFEIGSSDAESGEETLESRMDQDIFLYWEESEFRLDESFEFDEILWQEGEPIANQDEDGSTMDDGATLDSEFRDSALADRENESADLREPYQEYGCELDSSSQECLESYVETDEKLDCFDASQHEGHDEGNQGVEYSPVVKIWERQNSYQGAMHVWDPGSMSYISLDHNEVYQFDAAPYFLFSDRPEMWTANYRCMHTSPTDALGWHRTREQNQADWAYGQDPAPWCQRVAQNPWLVPAGYFPQRNRWWSQATAATWFSIEVWSEGKPDFFLIIRFTENKTMLGSDGKLRRAAPPLEQWGYADIKMDGTASDPDSRDWNSVTDGYYQGFVTVAKLRISQDNNWGANSIAEDLGPVVWPRRGYRQWRNDLGPPPGHGAAWQQTSTGCRHPTAFLWEGNVYLYYLSDAGIAPDGTWDVPGKGGIFVARARISPDMGPGKWLCGPTFSVSCLPREYSVADRDSWEASLSLAGPDVDPILDSDSYPGITSFWVSALSGTSPQTFVGVAELFDSGKGYVKLFTSSDLVHWTYHSTALTYSGAWNQDMVLHYPRAVRAVDGDTNTVNPEYFYLVGGAGGSACNSWHCSVNRIAVSNFL